MSNELKAPNRRDLLALIVGTSLAAPAALSAQPARSPLNPRSMIRLRREGAASPQASLADVAWHQGHWIGEMPEGPVEHFTMSPRFGHMPGFVRAISPSGVLFYEISLFAEVGNSLTVRVKHFTPELAGWEAQDAYIDRPLIERDGPNLYFDGITYSRTGEDSYVVYFLNRWEGEERDTLVVPFRRVAGGGIR
jgi:hypothetical protein